MDCSTEPLIVGNVIGDVVDMFTPAVDLSVSFVPKQVDNGCEIKPSAATNGPKIHASGPRASTSLYTLAVSWWTVVVCCSRAMVRWNGEVRDLEV
ncbi:hypothetical protein LguiA_015058 [Lonicera macranthoides]